MFKKRGRTKRGGGAEDRDPAPTSPLAQVGPEAPIHATGIGTGRDGPAAVDEDVVMGGTKESAPTCTRPESLAAATRITHGLFGSKTASSSSGKAKTSSQVMSSEEEDDFVVRKSSSKLARRKPQTHFSTTYGQAESALVAADTPGVSRDAIESRAKKEKKKKKRSKRDKKSKKSNKSHKSKRSSRRSEASSSSSSEESGGRSGSIPISRHITAAPIFNAVQRSVQSDKDLYSAKALEQLKAEQLRRTTESEDEDEREWESELLKRSGNMSALNASEARNVSDERDLERMNRASGSKKAGAALFQAMIHDLNKCKEHAQGARRRLTQMTTDITTLEAQLVLSVAENQVSGQRHDALQSAALFIKGLRACLEAKAGMVRKACVAMWNIRRESASQSKSARQQAVADALSIAMAAPNTTIEIGDRGNLFPRRLVIAGDGTEKDEFGRDAAPLRQDALLATWPDVQAHWEESLKAALDGEGLDLAEVAKFRQVESRQKIIADQRANILKGLQLIFQDVGPPYNTLTACLGEIAKWRSALPQDYAAAYADLAITGIASVFVQLELARWDLFGSGQAAASVDAFFAWESAMSVAGFSNEVIASTYTNDVVPVVDAALKYAWDPISTGPEFLERIATILNHAESLPLPKGANLLDLRETVTERLCEAEMGFSLPLHSGSHGSRDSAGSKALFILQIKQLALCVPYLESCLVWADTYHGERRHELLGSIAALDARSKACLQDASSSIPPSYNWIINALPTLGARIAAVSKKCTQ